MTIWYISHLTCDDLSHVITWQMTNITSHIWWFVCGMSYVMTCHMTNTTHPQSQSSRDAHLGAREGVTDLTQLGGWRRVNRSQIWSQFWYSTFQNYNWRLRSSLLVPHMFYSLLVGTTINNFLFFNYFLIPRKVAWVGGVKVKSWVTKKLRFSISTGCS